MPKIILENITKRWGGFYGADHLNFTIEDNAFVTLLGPSGCGKTTTLRMIAGLETPTEGRILFDDKVIFDSKELINISPSKRHVGFLFQNYALWPHMTVYENITLGLKELDEELPVIDDEFIKFMNLGKVVLDTVSIKKYLSYSYDKKGKLIKERAILFLIDGFKISHSAAKEIFDLHFENVEDSKLQEVAKENSEKFINKALEFKAKVQKAGFDLNEKGEYISNGQVVIKERKLSKEEIDLRARKVSRIVHIGEFMDRYPSELSGGQQQRVAIARTLAPEPKIIFMDEPLSNLDAKLRLEMRSELKRLHIDTGATFVYVTHDQQEAMTLASKICLMNNGVIQQYDEPLKVYKEPVNLFVADFIGSPSINLVEGLVTSDKKEIEITIFDKVKAKFKPNNKVDLTAIKEQVKQDVLDAENLKAAKEKEKNYVEKENADRAFNYQINKVEGVVTAEEEHDVPDNLYLLGIRPEFVKISTSKTNLEAEVYSALPTGSETTVKLKVGDYILTSTVYGGTNYKVGEKVFISFDTNGILLFERTSGKMVSLGELSI